MAVKSLLGTTVLSATLLIPGPAAAQLPGQSFEVIPRTARATVGDSVVLRFRVRLHERDMLLDSVPRVVGPLPPGVRVLSVEQLSRSADRLFHGRARLAFYRTGRQPIPTFGLTFMRVVEGVPRATLPSDRAFVNITPVLPAGSPELKDIREIEHTPGPPLFPLALGLALAAGLALHLVLRRRHRPAPPLIRPEPAPPPVAPDPYAAAVDRLDRVEQAHWPGQGEVARHYEAVVDILRGYLEDAEDVRARERTTAELLWALPPHLTAEGLRTRCHEVLAEADLVKFAEVRPSDATAAGFLRRARRLLESWHEAGTVDEGIDAVR